NELLLPTRSRHTPAFRWLYESVRDGILQGRLQPGERLPSTREMARQYGLARGTIVNAFDQLRAESYIHGSVGSGTYVNRVLPERLLHVAASTEKPSAQRQPAFRPSKQARNAKSFGGYGMRPTRAFRANLPALNLFPIELWTKLTTHCLRRMSTSQLVGCDPLGFLRLREAVADLLNRSRGVRCAPEQVAILSGVQEALDLTLRLLVNPGDRVCMENPGYPGAALAFRAIGAS